MTGTDWTWLGSGTFLDTQIKSGVLRVNGLLTSPVAVQAEPHWPEPAWSTAV